MHWRNNLILGQNAQPAVFSLTTNTNYSSSDYNGFRAAGAEPFQWNSPAADVVKVDADEAGQKRIQQRSFPSLEAYAQATRQDQHSLLVDYDVRVAAGFGTL